MRKCWVKLVTLFIHGPVSSSSGYVPSLCSTLSHNSLCISIVAPLEFLWREAKSHQVMVLLIREWIKTYAYPKLWNKYFACSNLKFKIKYNTKWDFERSTDFYFTNNENGFGNDTVGILLKYLSSSEDEFQTMNWSEL